MPENCIVIPCYNEENRLPKQQFIKYLSTVNNTHFYFVDDGSTDNTLNVLNRLHQSFSDKVFILSLKVNTGKAEAVREGINKALSTSNYNYVGYLDADLATSLDDMNEIMEFAGNHSKYDLVMGARISRLGAIINRNKTRHYLGRVFATLVSIMLGLPVYDTQCGAKLVKASVAKEIFDQSFVSKWFFDVELLFRYKTLIEKSAITFQVYEYPLHRWKEVGKSRIELFDFLKVPFELLKIRKKYKKNK